jgi:hypothetical protein
MKSLRFGLVALLLVSLAGLSTEADAQSKNQPPKSSGSSGDKPKFSAPPPSKPNPPADKPKFSAPPPKQEHKEEPKSKFSSPPSTPKKEPHKEESKSKFTAPTIPHSGPVLGSEKPKAGNVSEKARSNKEAESQRKYVESTKAVSPPKPKYTTADGKEVSVRTASKDVEAIRSLPSKAIQPEIRQKNITVHVTNYHYQHPYTYYQSQPYIYVGSGYSSAIFYMMLEWDAERRARWLYNHRYEISEEAYLRGVREGRTQEALNRLEQQRSYRDPNYIDPEFKSDPSAQYTDEYVHHAYNPDIDHSSGSGFFNFLGILLIFGVAITVLYFLFFRVRF